MVSLGRLPPPPVVAPMPPVVAPVVAPPTTHVTCNFNLNEPTLTTPEFEAKPSPKPSAPPAKELFTPDDFKY